MLTDLNTMDLKCTVPMYQLPTVDINTVPIKIPMTFCTESENNLNMEAEKTPPKAKMIFQQKTKQNKTKQIRGIIFLYFYFMCMGGLPSFQPQDFTFLDFKLHYKATVPFVPLAQSTGQWSRLQSTGTRPRTASHGWHTALAFIALHRALLS